MNELNIVRGCAARGIRRCAFSSCSPAAALPSAYAVARTSSAATSTFAATASTCSSPVDHINATTTFTKAPAEADGEIAPSCTSRTNAVTVAAANAKLARARVWGALQTATTGHQLCKSLVRMARMLEVDGGCGHKRLKYERRLIRILLAYEDRIIREAHPDVLFRFATLLNGRILRRWSSESDVAGGHDDPVEKYSAALFPAAQVEVLEKDCVVHKERLQAAGADDNAGTTRQPAAEVVQLRRRPRPDGDNSRSSTQKRKQKCATARSHRNKSIYAAFSETGWTVGNKCDADELMIQESGDHTIVAAGEAPAVAVLTQQKPKKVLRLNAAGDTIRVEERGVRSKRRGGSTAKERPKDMKGRELQVEQDEGLFNSTEPDPDPRPDPEVKRPRREDLEHVALEKAQLALRMETKKERSLSGERKVADGSVEDEEEMDTMGGSDAAPRRKLSFLQRRRCRVRDASPEAPQWGVLSPTALSSQAGDMVRGGVGAGGGLGSGNLYLNENTYTLEQNYEAGMLSDEHNRAARRRVENLPLRENYEAQTGTPALGEPSDVVATRRRIPQEEGGPRNTATRRPSFVRLAACSAAAAVRRRHPEQAAMCARDTATGLRRFFQKALREKLCARPWKCVFGGGDGLPAELPGPTESENSTDIAPAPVLYSSPRRRSAMIVRDTDWRSQVRFLALLQTAGIAHAEFRFYVKRLARHLGRELEGAAPDVPPAEGTKMLEAIPSQHPAPCDAAGCHLVQERITSLARGGELAPAAIFVPSAYAVTILWLLSRTIRFGEQRMARDESLMCVDRAAHSSSHGGHPHQDMDISEKRTTFDARQKFRLLRKQLMGLTGDAAAAGYNSGGGVATSNPERSLLDRTCAARAGRKSLEALAAAGTGGLSSDLPNARIRRSQAERIFTSSGSLRDFRLVATRLAACIKLEDGQMRTHSSQFVRLCDAVAFLNIGSTGGPGLDNSCDSRLRSWIGRLQSLIGSACDEILFDPAKQGVLTERQRRHVTTLLWADLVLEGDRMGRGGDWDHERWAKRAERVIFAHGCSFSSSEGIGGDASRTKSSVSERVKRDQIIDFYYRSRAEAVPVTDAGASGANSLLPSDSVQGHEAERARTAPRSRTAFDLNQLFHHGGQPDTDPIGHLRERLRHRCVIWEKDRSLWTRPELVGPLSSFASLSSGRDEAEPNGACDSDEERGIIPKRTTKTPTRPRPSLQTRVERNVKDSFLVLVNGHHDNMEMTRNNGNACMTNGSTTTAGGEDEDQHGEARGAPVLLNGFEALMMTKSISSLPIVVVESSRMYSLLSMRKLEKEIRKHLSAPAHRRQDQQQRR